MTNLLFRMWWVLLLGAIVAATAAFVTVSGQPDQYQARVRLLVGDLSDTFDEIRASESLANTYAELATSDVLLSQAMELAGVELDLDALDDRVAAVTVGTSRILLVTVRMEDAPEAQDLANAIASTLQGFSGSPSQPLTVIDPAGPAKKLPTRLPFLVGIAGIGGAGLVASLMLMVEAATSTSAARRWLGEVTS